MTVKGPMFLREDDSSDNWPQPVKRAMVELTRIAEGENHPLLAIVIYDALQRTPLVFLPPKVGCNNPHLAGMCDQISDMFRALGTRLRQ